MSWRGYKTPIMRKEAEPTFEILLLFAVLMNPSDPRKSRKMPGLSKGPFFENPVKRPDSIRGINDVHSARGV